MSIQIVKPAIPRMGGLPIESMPKPIPVSHFRPVEPISPFQRKKRKLKLRGLGRQLQSLAYASAEPVLRLTPAGCQHIGERFAEGQSVGHIAAALAMSKESVEKELVRQGMIRLEGTRRIRDSAGIRDALDRDMRERARRVGLVLP